METRYLLAWSVPDHVLIPVEQFRKRLFAETGCISLRALEPFIPIGYIHEPFTSQDLPKDIEKPNPITWDILDVQEQTLMLTSKTPFTLSDSHIGFSTSVEQDPIPAIPGIFLGSEDICRHFDDNPGLFEDMQGSFEDAVFTLSHIIMIKLTFFSPETWWENVFYSTVKLKSLR